MASVFDFSRPLDFSSFYAGLQEVFIHEKFNDKEILQAIKHFYFILLDANNDGYIC